MILKVKSVQSIFDNYKRDPRTSKNGFKKRKASFFDSILDSTIKSNSTSLLTKYGVFLLL